MQTAPNPTVGDLTITTDQTTFSKPGLVISNKIYKLEVIDVFGNIKNKFSYSFGETNIKIKLSTLVSGTYVIRAYNGKIWTYKKIVIAR
ncbi:MAG TPA: T9SS type A sorting domain-containing protein [Segetibacter sp.]